MQFEFASTHFPIQPSPLNTFPKVSLLHLTMQHSFLHIFFEVLPNRKRRNDVIKRTSKQQSHSINRKTTSKANPGMDPSFLFKLSCSECESKGSFEFFIFKVPKRKLIFIRRHKKIREHCRSYSEGQKKYVKERGKLEKFMTFDLCESR